MENGIIFNVINIFAVIIAPVVAVVIGQWLQNQSEKRKDKMIIFRTLMTSRIYDWTVEGVHALNMIDIVFSDDEKVRSAWKDLFDKYHVEKPTQMQINAIKQSKHKLLETMANSLGYKDKITWETIQNPYIPNGMVNQLNIQQQSQNAFCNILNTMTGVGQQINNTSNPSMEESAE